MSDKDSASDDDVVTREDGSSRDWNKLKANNSKAGYMAGISAGREASVQDGFIKGYQHASNNAFTTLAKWRGILGAVLCYFDQSGEEADNSVKEKVTRLIEKLLQVQQVLATPEREHLTMLSTLIGQSEEVRSSIAKSNKEAHCSTPAAITKTTSSSDYLESYKHNIDKMSTSPIRTLPPPSSPFIYKTSPTTPTSPFTSVICHTGRPNHSNHPLSSEHDVTASKKLKVDKEDDSNDKPLNLVMEKKKPKRDFKLDLPKKPTTPPTEDYRMLLMAYDDKNRLMEIQRECKKVVGELGLQRISHLFDSM